ncbi:acetyl-CoA carboxylase biotin carboxyl carrier protein subunit [Adhaeribacter rhizoryzae]|uniref:Acetyl-CoA carboxylase biotin carboxyl carrier protein subunit n=1 Tax=Adhaeribacter rhizoryzae TaxID=2607907 RepID=A0A5M6DSY8_9BACT|nr:acetyl-CoA carboxylase biotin carboxyl carrier protein subunit [Adhaeribacter rhizoryzae]KAA5549369.1 acetyl-CoA carboxylase biotin carboxyl carrier protein subunit [Adhaeribacter rhizoryzae]
MLQVITANDKKWQIDFNKSEILVNATPFAWDITVIRPGVFHIIKDNISYNAELVQADYQTKTFLIKINGHLHSLTVKDRFDLLLDQMGMTQTNVHKVNEIKAPMPGLIVAIKVEPGQEVKKGDPLLVLEAMKMENILKSPGDGVVKTIKVNLRDNVEKNQVLILFQA